MTNGIRAQFLRSSALFGATAVVVAAYAVSQNMYSLMMVSEVVWGFFWAIFTPTCGTLVADYTEEGQRSEVLHSHFYLKECVRFPGAPDGTYFVYEIW